MADFTWSYSALKQYTNCPKQYQEMRVLKNYTIKETEAMMYGKEVHAALEDYVKDGKELAKNYQRFKPMVDTLVNIKGDKYPEYEMALTHAKTPCDFHSEDRWVRGIADLVIVDGDTAFVIDYKTGSNRYPDPKQLRLMSLMLFTHFPDVQRIKGGLLFVMKNSFITEEYIRKDMDKSWGMFEQSLKRLEMSYDNDVWQANPTPLCGWCSVTTCDFNKT
jgi:CRISPR/Cas system-associated exonuclease Cas4 (RecB family)